MASAFPPAEQRSSGSLVGRALEGTEVKLVLTSPKHQTLCAEAGTRLGCWSQGPTGIRVFPDLLGQLRDGW